MIYLSLSVHFTLPLYDIFMFSFFWKLHIADFYSQSENICILIRALIYWLLLSQLIGYYICCFHSCLLFFVYLFIHLFFSFNMWNLFSLLFFVSNDWGEVLERFIFLFKLSCSISVCLFVLFFLNTWTYISLLMLMRKLYQLNLCKVGELVLFTSPIPLTHLFHRFCWYILT